MSFQPGQQLIVEANPRYAGKKNDFSKLVFVFLDEDNAYAAARSGQLGLVRIAPSMAVAPQQKNLKLWVRDSVENRGIVFPMVPAGKKTPMAIRLGTISLPMLPSGAPSTTPSTVSSLPIRSWKAMRFRRIARFRVCHGRDNQLRSKMAIAKSANDSGRSRLEGG